MIRNVVVHLHNEQPVLADLYALPTAADACLVCTNLRTMGGKRPVFVDQVDSFFLFPLVHIRFVEIPPGAAASSDSTALATSAGEAGEQPLAEPDLEIDEDFLRRVRDI